MSVAGRMKLLVGISLIGLVAMWLTALYILKDSMLDDRKEQTRRIVETGMGILDHYQKLAAAGTLKVEDAQRAAKDALRNVRYGQNDYFFIFTTGHVYVINPAKPEVEGQNKADMQDANGKYLVRALVTTAQQGGGFVDYAFPRAGQNQPEPKISYAALFTPWNWVLGTGIYVDDVETAYRKIALLLGAISLAILLGIGILGVQTTRSITHQLGGDPAVAQAAMREMAGGNLVVEVGNPPPDSLLGSLSTMEGALRGLVKQIELESDSLVANASEITKASEGVTRAAEEEADSTSAIAAAIEELTVSSSQILDIARETEANSQEAARLAVQGSERVGQAGSAIAAIARTVTDASDHIGALEERAKEVSSIAGVIKEIASQTNLLALNAAIEAARAGEQGRGFAVVADEVRKLAERTTAATTDIETMIEAIQVDTGAAVKAMRDALPVVQEGVELANGASESLHAIQEGAKLALDRVHDVADATREQSAASTNIAQRVERIAQMVEETSVTIRANAETAASLERIARNLREQVARFKT
jgi:methyl-accepting chemotaxis protein